MKKSILFVFVILSFMAVQSKAAVEFGGDGYFYTALAPYGEWIELNDGMTVWHPTMMGRNWVPYTMGRWEWTADGWYWDTDEPFGYITYHYGRWYNDDYYGWLWVPDEQWAPAWVEWRYDDDYVGWAPLSPYGVFQIGIGLHFTHEYHPHYRFWNFVAYNHFCDNNVYNYYAGPTYKYRIYNDSRFRNDYDYSNGRVINRGVGYDVVRERSGRPIRTREIIRTSDPRQVTGNRDKNVIRTYVATRQDLSRNNLRDINIKRQDRKTTMDVSKITLGERNSGGKVEIPADRQTPNKVRDFDGWFKQERELQNRIPERQIDQQNRQKQQQTDQLNQQRSQNIQRQQQIDQQNRQKQQVQQRQQQIDQQNRQRQQVQERQQVDQQNRQRQQVQQRQQVDQQNRQRQQVQQRQQVDQQNRQRQQVQQRQQVDQQNRQRQQVQQRQQTEQKKQQTDRRNDSKDSGRNRR